MHMMQCWAYVRSKYNGVEAKIPVGAINIASHNFRNITKHSQTPIQRPWFFTKICASVSRVEKNWNIYNREFLFADFHMN